MTIIVDANPAGRHGKVLTHDLPPTPEQRALQELIDNLGKAAVQKTAEPSADSDAPNKVA